ncbi:MAG TPA: hypothetical protein VNQ73_16155 [Ilumatobacter sp.]|nr:hypothetical protein [Ilumatobacter sp.]
MIRPERVHLRDWIDAVPGLGAYAPLAPQWFKLFGADIKRFARDRDARNFASYRPSRITQRTFGTAGQTAEFVANLWQLIDQDTASFARLDRHLLRIATEQAFVVAQHGAAGVGSPAFVQAVDQQIAGLQLTEVQAASMRAFQLRQASPTDSLLVHHGRQPVRRLAADHHLDVMARAAVLARIATGASRALLDVAGIQLPQLHFWWGAVLTDRGFSNTASIEDLEDAAEDVRAAAADLDDWSKDPGVDTYESLRVVCRDAIGLVDAPELAGVFGLAS